MLSAALGAIKLVSGLAHWTVLFYLLTFYSLLAGANTGPPNLCDDSRIK